MRLNRNKRILDARPFRHSRAEDLFLMALFADRRTRRAIEHELDLRRAKRLVGRFRVEELDEPYTASLGCEA